MKDGNRQADRKEKNPQRQIQTDGEVIDTDRRRLRQIQTDGERKRHTSGQREKLEGCGGKKEYTVNEML